MNMDALLNFIRSRYPGQERIALHEPRFRGNEKRYVDNAIDSTFVSSVGEYVTRFESMLRDVTGAQHAVAAVNGTAALHMALLLADVKPGDLVLTQALSFVATANAIAHAGAEPVFLDIEKSTLGLDPDSLRLFLSAHTEKKGRICTDKATGKRYAACVPMHTFGHPCRIEAILDLCEEYGIPVVEDAAEALGSLWHGQHCGTFGLMGTLSFNGNKIVTTGGGGAIITNNSALAIRAKHLTTTAKKPHPWLFEHDETAYNYRMPNLNAALGCAQLEQLDGFIEDKRTLAREYLEYCATEGIPFMEEPPGAKANYWLNSVFTKDREARDAFLALSNGQGIQSRPAWGLLPAQPMYAQCRCAAIPVATEIADRLVNIPSSVQ
jgi:aminotransferase in exopolysaccharide biosynthesis